MLTTRLTLSLRSPEWYNLLEEELAAASPTQASQEEKHSSFSTLESEQSSNKEKDDFVEEDVISLSSSSREGSTPTNMLDTTGGHSKWKLESLPSSGIITTKSPPPNLELPLIADGFQRAFTFSAQNGWRELVSTLTLHEGGSNMGCPRVLKEQLKISASCSKTGSIRDDPYWTSR